MPLLVFVLAALLLGGIVLVVGVDVAGIVHRLAMTLHVAAAECLLDAYIKLLAEADIKLVGFTGKLGSGRGAGGNKEIGFPVIIAQTAEAEGERAATGD